MNDSSDVQRERVDFLTPDSLIAQKLRMFGASNHYASATLEVTSRCNALCNYCYIDSSKATDLSREQIFYILDKLSAEGILMITFTGGEPFLHRDFVDVIKYTIKKDFWKISIITNGSCMDEYHIQFLTENAKYFSSVQFSAFSHIPSVHDSYTGIPGSYQKLIDSAKQLNQSNIPVKIAFNVIESNFRTFEDSIAFFTKAGFQVSWSVHKLITNCSSPKSCEQIRRETSVPFFREFISMLKEDNIKLERERYVRLLGKIPADELTLCNGLFSNIYVDSRGNLLPCVSFRNMIIGNIFDERPLHEILGKSTSLQKLKSMRISDIPKCGKCKYNNVCHICVGMNHTETGSVKTPCEQHCNYTYSLASFFGLKNG